MEARIDFIICEHSGTWFTHSEDVPAEIARKSNEDIVAWYREKGQDVPSDAFYIGVYWRDPNVDEVSSTNIMN